MDKSTPQTSPKPPIREPQRARPQFNIRTLLWITTFVAIFAAFGFSFELLIGMAWLALAPAILLLLAILQYPLLTKVVQRTDEEDLKETGKPSS